MQSDRLTERVREIVSTIFDVPLDHVSAATSAESVERWDSLGRLVLTVELEQEFGVQVTPEQGELLTSVEAIVDWLDSQSVRAASVEARWEA